MHPEKSFSLGCCWVWSGGPSILATWRTNQPRGLSGFDLFCTPVSCKHFVQFAAGEKSPTIYEKNPILMLFSFLCYSDTPFLIPSSHFSSMSNILYLQWRILTLFYYHSLIFAFEYSWILQILDLILSLSTATGHPWDRIEQMLQSRTGVVRELVDVNVSRTNLLLS